MLALACLALTALVGCGSGSSLPTQQLQPIPTSKAPGAVAEPTPLLSPSVGETPEANVGESPNTSATHVQRPNRGIAGEVGEILFGTGYNVGRNVKLLGERNRFPLGTDVAWRVTLSSAAGGESVAVVLVDDDGSETLVDEFTAEAGWNVYYGQLSSDLPAGTYRLRYYVDDKQTAGGRFTIRGAAAAPTPRPQPGGTQRPTPEPEPEPEPEPQADCDSAYPDVCIPPYPPDLDCGDVPYDDIWVPGPDPHGFDGNDNDGLGCES